MKNSAKGDLFCVYGHIAPNGKRYYGITSKSLRSRWNNGNGYRSNKHFWSAIQKYGWNQFQHEIILENVSLEDACEKEKEMISTYHTDNPLYGYNNTKGGETNVEISDTCRKKMSESAKKRGMSEKLIYYTQNMPPKDGVEIYYDGKVFISIVACAKYIGIKRGTLVGYLRGIDAMPEEYKEKGLSYNNVPHEYVLSNKARYKKVMYKGVLYPSLNSCDKALGVRQNTISEILSHRMKPPKWLDVNDLVLVDNKRYYYKVLE
jgi:hypothetical protein